MQLASVKRWPRFLIAPAPSGRLSERESEGAIKKQRGLRPQLHRF